MARTTPGLDFLGWNLFKPSMLCLAISTANHLFSFHFATWMLLVAPFLGTAAYTVGRIALNRWIERLEATKMGSRLASRCQCSHSVVDKAIGLFRGLRGCRVSVMKLPEEVGPNIPIMNHCTMWSNNIVTTCPEHVKIIVAENPQNFVKGETFYQATSSTIGTGVFTTDGSLWNFHRSVVRPLFLRSHQPAHLELCDRHAQHAVTHLDFILDAGYHVDLLDLFRRTSLNVATEMLLGACVSSLPRPRDACPNPESSFLPEMDFSAATLRIQEVISRREELGPLWPLCELLSDHTKESMRVVCQTLDPLILAAMGKKMMRGVGVLYSAGEKATNVPDGKENGTLLDQLAELTDESYQIRDVILNVLIPQRDNVALTLTSIVYYLDLHPRVASRLREEINLGPTRRPNVDDLRGMRYLRAVINETLRLAPPISCTTRETMAATTWPSPHPKENPIYIPARTKVSYDVSTIHTSKDLWGPDADQFDPDRFIDGRYQEYLVPNPYIFLPFGAGPRVCFGKELAYDEISIMLIRLLQGHPNFGMDTLAEQPMSPIPIQRGTRLIMHNNGSGLQLSLDGGSSALRSCQ